MKVEELFKKSGFTTVGILLMWIIGRLERGYFAFGAEGLVTIAGLIYVGFLLKQYIYDAEIAKTDAYMLDNYIEKCKDLRKEITLMIFSIKEKDTEIENLRKELNMKGVNKGA